MNYKALLLAFLMLLPVGLIALPRTNASHGVPGLYVFPKDTKFFGPCIKSTTFKIDVFLWNIAATDYDVYAFDFNLTWTGLPIKLVNATFHSPWANFFPIANETYDSNYHLALTATPPSGGLFDYNASVLTLYFHVEKDYCWPDQFTGVFQLINNGMSSDGTKPVPIPGAEMDNGTYEQYSVQPNIELSTTDAAYNATTGLLTEKCASHTFDIEVDLTNVTNVYGFGFIINFNSSYLETDVQKISPKPTFAGPYEYTAVYVGPGHVSTSPDTSGITLTADQILVVFVRPSEKPGICGAVVPVVDIIFHTIWDANTTMSQIPTAWNSTIAITKAFVMAKCGLSANQYGWSWVAPGEYDSTDSFWGGMFGYVPGWVITNTKEYFGITMPFAAAYTFSIANLGLIVGDPITYAFKPSKYDLNLDCVVDIQDLKVLLPYYGKTLPAGNYGDLWAPLGIVDIFDFVAIAKKFGPVDP